MISIYWVMVLQGIFLLMFGFALAKYIGSLGLCIAGLAAVFFYLLFKKKTIYIKKDDWRISVNAIFLAFSVGYLLGKLILKTVLEDDAIWNCLLIASISLSFVIPSFALNSFIKNKVRSGDDKFSLYLSCSLVFLYFVICIDYPIEVFLNNPSEFSFSLRECVFAVMTCLPLLMVIIVLLSFFPSKVKKTIFVGTGTIVVLVYVQNMFFNRYLGSLAGGKYVWDEHPVYTFANVAVWILSFCVAFFALFLKKKKTVPYLFRAELLVCMLLLVSLVANIIRAPKEAFQYKFNYVDGSEEFTLGSQDNVIIYMVDAVDNSFVKEIYADEPGFFNEFCDFTLYSDTCSVYDKTAQSLPQMLLGYTFQENENTDKSDLFLKRYRDAGFRILFYNVFEGMQLTEIDNFRKYSEDSERFAINYNRIRSDLFKISLLKGLPCIAKGVITIDEIKAYNYIQYDNSACDMVADNKSFREKMDLTLNGHSKNCFYYFHLDGAHYPCEDYIEETKYCLDSFKEYMRQMKLLGVYDNATIIICSDHGRHDDDGELLFPSASTPMFMIKEKGVTHPYIQISETPVYYTDFQSTVLRASGLFDPKTDYDIFGKSIYDYEEKTVRERTWFDSGFHNQGIHKYTYVGGTTELERVVREGIYEEVDSWAFDYQGE